MRVKMMWLHMLLTPTSMDDGLNKHTNNDQSKLKLMFSMLKMWHYKTEIRTANDHQTVCLWHMWFIQLNIKTLIVFAVLLNPFFNT